MGDPQVHFLKSVVSNSHRPFSHSSRPPELADISPIIPRCKLPVPQPIVRELLGKGLKYTAAEKLSQIYLKHAVQLQNEYERNLEVTTRSLLTAESIAAIDGRTLPVLQSTYRTMYESKLRQYIETIMASASRRVTTILSDHNAPGGFNDQRTNFKRAIPILEDAFTLNAYPTRTEKVRLAKDVGMDLKQIHIWFQNRRSRVKREGRDISKLVVHWHSRSTTPEESFTPIMSSFPISECLSLQEATPRVPDLALKPDTLSMEAALHAFPSPYPPTCDYDPFPIADGSSHLETMWPRLPARHVPRLKPAPDVDDVSSTLARTTIVHQGEVSERHGSVALPVSRNTAYSNACFPSAVLLPVAPLPALVRATVTVHTAGRGSGPSSLYTLTQHKTYEPKIYTNENLARGLSSPSLASIRAGSSLPRRGSKSTSTLVRAGGRPYISTSSPHYCLRRTRLSSSSSLSSICSTSSSSSMSSSPSSVDSPLVTPPQLPVDLPLPFKSSTPMFMLGPITESDRLSNSPASSEPYDGLYFSALACC